MIDFPFPGTAQNFPVTAGIKRGEVFMRKASVEVFHGKIPQNIGVFVGRSLKKPRFPTESFRSSAFLPVRCLSRRARAPGICVLWWCPGPMPLGPIWWNAPTPGGRWIWTQKLSVGRCGSPVFTWFLAVFYYCLVLCSYFLYSYLSLIKFLVLVPKKHHRNTIESQRNPIEVP